MNGHASHGESLNRIAASATLHCLSGCAVGEVLGLAIGTLLGWSTPATIALAVTLAFAFGYSFTMVPLLRRGMALGVALPIAFAADSVSIAVMELVDNGVMIAVPGAMDSGLSDGLFWVALAFALMVAYAVAFPLNRYLIGHGRGHAVVPHGHMIEGGTQPSEILHGRQWKLIAAGVLAMLLTIAVTTVGAAALG